MEVSVLLTEKEILKFSNDADLGELVRQKYHRLKEELERSMDLEYDHCVICGKQSPYTLNTNTGDRIGYVDGGGQGCFSPNICDKI